ncbi:ATP-binding protein [Rhizobium grahamii]|uniref:ATP-binding protein n=1 Tax=Rhizobium grahamii TaxID=1120045 RepID=UPI001FD33978|nr:ATP-binding protein [Rhizobium grahamii]
MPLDPWWGIIANPTLAHAILGRLVHNAYSIDLTGESMRKQRPPLAARSVVP